MSACWTSCIMANLKYKQIQQISSLRNHVNCLMGILRIYKKKSVLYDQMSVTKNVSINICN